MRRATTRCFRRCGRDTSYIGSQRQARSSPSAPATARLAILDRAWPPRDYKILPRTGSPDTAWIISMDSTRDSDPFVRVATRPSRICSHPAPTPHTPDPLFGRATHLRARAPSPMMERGSTYVRGDVFSSSVIRERDFELHSIAETLQPSALHPAQPINDRLLPIHSAEMYFFAKPRAEGLISHAY